jgi:hypothetical protein
MKTLLIVSLALIIFASCVHHTCPTYSSAKKIMKRDKPRVLAFQGWK